MTAPVRAASAPGTLRAALEAHRAVAVVRRGDLASAREIARACIAGGMGLIEITLTTPGACDLIAELAADAPDGVLIGAGTVRDADDVAAAVRAGARFLVSPTTDREALEAAATSGVPMVPGAATPTEVALGARLGAPVVKVFPAGTLGPAFVRAVAAVLPDVPLLPSGGIAAGDVGRWLDAGALAVAIGGDLDAAHATGGADAVTAVAASLAALRAATPSQAHLHATMRR